ncbi:MAG: prolyl endopeptidase [Chloroflexi bacterium RBG_13_48_10]|nr:MAG: prolyl endopeptidase [Chloroflexi bacterium RBG_13_48_10]
MRGPMKLSYPITKTTDQVDDFHGTHVADPYRWLEDVDSPETLEWIKQQNELTFGFLEKIPVREHLRQRLTELWDYPKAQAPIKHGGRYFQLRNSGLQNQDVLYVLENLTANPRLLLDPNTLSTDGTVALNSWEVSPDGKWLAYATSSSGSDWQIWHIRNVDTAIDLPEMIEWSKFSGAAWMRDASGFFYARYDAPQAGEEFQGANYFQKLYFHRLGTPQSADVLIYERPDEKEWGFGAQVSEDGRYLVLNVSLGTDVRNRIFYRDLQGGTFSELITELEAAYTFLGNDGSTFYFRTDLDAPRGRLIAIDTTNPSKSNWQTLIPESQLMLESIKIVNDQFVAVINRDAHHEIWCYGLDGKRLKEIHLPALGTVFTNFEYVVSGTRTDNELFYGFTSFLFPLTVYRYDFSTDTNEIQFSPPVPFDSSVYETRQVFVHSKDGTQIPLFLTHKKGLSLDGQNPTLLYGYGGFSISLMPGFATSRLVWLELGGVYAQAVLRGGAEYGEEWHQAGMLGKKQNVFDDFIACAEWLIAKKITSTPKLAINGGSNGGLLVGACMTQRPDLFGACLPAVGVMDMLRFHKFTIGWAWVSDYGSAEDPEQFKTLYSYSPLHNLRPGTKYPPTLITTADHDDRVVPGHSFKFAAALQATQSGEAPTLIRIQTKAGHGFGKPTAILIEELADMYAFLSWALGDYYPAIEAMG